MRFFDCHSDTLTACYPENLSLCRNDRHVDLYRGRRFVPWCQVFAVWIPDEMRSTAAWRYCCRVLDFAREQEQRYPQQLAWVHSGSQLQTAVAQGVCSGILAVENAAPIAARLERLRLLADRGVRVITLTWNGDNAWGHGCLSKYRDGLTAVGKRGLAMLYSLGIVPDVSHLNEAGFWDVAAANDRPFIASHSLSRTVHDHPRNLTDAQFAEICRRGGLVGISLCPEHIGEATFEGVYRHLAHYWSLGGEKTVAWGGDLDGVALPNGWNGIAVFEELWEFLLKKGIDEPQLERLFFENAFEFFVNTLQDKKNAVQ